MSKKKIKPEIMWAIHGVHGFYYGAYRLRSDAIRAHTNALGDNWQYCKDKGDIAIKVTIAPAVSDGN